MIENELYKYWTEDLSLKNLSKSKKYKVVLNWKGYFVMTLLIIAMIILWLIAFYPLLSWCMSFIPKNPDILAICLLFNLLIVALIIGFGKVRFDLRWLINKRKKDVPIYELKEDKLKKYIEHRYLDNKKDNTEYYKTLIQLCEKRGNPEKIDIQIFFALITFMFALCSFLFSGINELETKSNILYGIFMIVLIVSFYYYLIKIRMNKDKYVYSHIADALNRILLKKMQKK